jgi:hypothetical protein
VTLADRAEAILRGAATGEAISRDEAHGLARDWLAATAGDVALAVLTGGELEAARIVELCERIITTATTRQVDEVVS